METHTSHQMGVAIVIGYPFIAGWFISWNSQTKIRMITRDTPILGTPHMTTHPKMTYFISSFWKMAICPDDVFPGDSSNPNKILHDIQIAPQMKFGSHNLGACHSGGFWGEFILHTSFYAVVRRERFGTRGVHIPYDSWGASWNYELSCPTTW